MIILMDPRCTDGDVERVVDLVDAMGSPSCVVDGPGGRIVEIPGAAAGRVDRSALAAAPMVERVLDGPEALLVRRRRLEDRTREVPLGGRAMIGGRRLAVIAGPCSVESREQLLETAAAVKEAGAVALRGGAFKPRTSPYSFQGLGEEGLELLALAREQTGLAVVTEVMCRDQVEMVAKYADVLQVGSRNMHCPLLLTAVGQQTKPVLLKRGWSATLEEYVLAAEYIVRAGNPNVILCERGIRTFEEYVRNTLALAVVPELKRLTCLPVVVDPSHGTGRRHLVPPMCKAAVACGADGLLVEVHPRPEQAWSDGDQSLDVESFRRLMEDIAAIADACGRTL